MDREYERQIELKKFEAEDRKRAVEQTNIDEKKLQEINMSENAKIQAEEHNTEPSTAELANSVKEISSLLTLQLSQIAKLSENLAKALNDPHADPRATQKLFNELIKIQQASLVVSTQLTAQSAKLKARLDEESASKVAADIANLANQAIKSMIPDKKTEKQVGETRPINKGDSSSQREKKQSDGSSLDFLQ